MAKFAIYLLCWIGTVVFAVLALLLLITGNSLWFVMLLLAVALLLTARVMRRRAGAAVGERGDGAQVGGERPRVMVAKHVRTGPPPGYVSPYMDAERAAELLVPGIEGMPPLHLVERDGNRWLAEDSTGLLVNVGTRQLRKLGIWSVRVRGAGHYPVKLSLGPVDLVRESDNEYDVNAVSILLDGRKIGYFNKRMAVGLAKELDSGAELEAELISIDPPKVIAADLEIMLHLFRERRRTG